MVAIIEGWIMQRWLEVPALVKVTTPYGSKLRASGMTLV
jgi:hypothetical protein